MSLLGTSILKMWSASSSCSLIVRSCRQEQTVLTPQVLAPPPSTCQLMLPVQMREQLFQLCLCRGDVLNTEASAV